MSKVKTKSPEEFKHVAAINKLHVALNQARRLSFQGHSLSGGDPFADTKHMKAWFDYGYPFTVDFYMHWNMYQRNGLARAGVNIPNTIAFLDYPDIKNGDGSEVEEQPWDKEVKRVLKQKRFWKHLSDGHRMQMVGRYAALFFRVRDGKSPDQPLTKLSGESSLVEIQPLWEGQLIPAMLETDTKSERYGRPVTYTYQSTGVGNQNAQAVESLTIHHTRLVILSENAVGGSIYGEPANEAGFNALLDWDKIRGSGGEASWLAAANKQVLTINNANSTIHQEDIDNINDAYRDMLEGLTESLVLKGVDSKSLGATVPDVQHYKAMAIEEYAASRQIPVKILIGTQTGVLAGDADSAGYMRIVQSDRNNKVTPMIEDCINWLVRYGILPPAPAGEFVVEWSDLTAPTAADRIDFAVKMATINNTNMLAGNGPVYSEDEMRKESDFEPLEEALPRPLPRVELY
jgi:hypothetical protein